MSIIVTLHFLHWICEGQNERILVHIVNTATTDTSKTYKFSRRNIIFIIVSLKYVVIIEVNSINNLSRRYFANTMYTVHCFWCVPFLLFQSIKLKNFTVSVVTFLLSHFSLQWHIFTGDHSLHFISKWQQQIEKHHIHGLVGGDQGWSCCSAKIFVGTWLR